jgi:hypothetical protein
MRDWDKFLESLANYPGYIPFITDSDLACILERLDILSARLRAPLLAEAWLRRWLYIGKFETPREFAIAFEQFSPDFKTAFTKLGAPWRKPRNEGHPLPPAEPPDVNLVEEELAVWQCFWKRLRDFVCCDGLIALVLEQNDSELNEAIAVPFNLNGTSAIRDAAQQNLKAWSDAISWLQEDYYRPNLGADLCGVIPSLQDPEQQNKLKGESVTLAVLLARERERAVNLPEFYPLDILATGGFRSGALQSVGGLKAKAELASRIGCRWFLRPESSVNGGKGALLSGTPLTELLPQVGRIVVNQGDKKSLARRALALCKRRLSAEAVTQSDAADIFRRLMQIRSALVDTPEAEICQETLREAAVCMRTSMFSTVDSQIESLLKEYRKKPFYGREPSFITLKQFLNGPGGIILVTGKLGYGKTALMTQLLDRIPDDRLVFRHFFSFKHQATRPLENFHTHLGLFLASVLGKSNLKGGYDEGAITVLMDELRDELKAHKLVFVLDGLDEANEILQPHYFQDLPKGIHIIAAARSSGEQQPERYLEPWHELEPKGLNLGELNDDELKVWLQKSPRSPSLQLLSNNATFREHLHKCASGCPRFIADVVADLASIDNLANTWQEHLKDVPPNYSDFIRKQYRQLKDTSAFNSAHETFLGLLCAAEGELSVREIQLVLPHECDRWISIYNSTDGDGDKYALQTLQIRDALRGVIPWTAQEQKLVEHCRSWHDHGTPYSLRHYAIHLKKNWKGIANLVLDARYRSKVAKRLPEETDLPLLILRSALERAIDESDWESISGLMIAHAELGNQMLRYEYRDEDPLEKIAGEVAEVLSHSDLGRAALMRLIKGWTLKWKGQPNNEIEEVRQGLSGQKLAMLNGLEADVAAELLFRIFEPDDERLVHIASQLLDEGSRRDLVALLANLQTNQGFKGARRILQTLPKTRRKETNYNFDKAVNALTIALARAGKWNEVIDLSEGLLPRQATFNLVEAGYIAVEKKLLDVLHKLKNIILRITESCASWEELHQRGILAQDLPWWRGTPKDRYTCRSNQARLLALIGLASENGESARLAWHDAFTLANGMKDKPEQRFHALRELVSAILEKFGQAGFEFVFASVNQEDRSIFFKYFNETENAWQDMSQNDQVFFSTVTHALANLIHLGEQVLYVAPGTIPDLNKRILSWREDLIERADMLNAEDRDRLWLRVGIEAAETPRLRVAWALAAVRNIEDHQMLHRAVAKLVSRLYRDGKGSLADRIGESNRRLQQPVRLATGLATLDFNHEKSTRQLLVRCLPRTTRFSIQLPLLKSELAVSLKRVDPIQSKRLLFEAVKQIKHPKTGLRFQLNVAESAWRADEKQTANDLLRIAANEALKEKRRVEKDWAKLKYKYTDQPIDEVSDDDLTQSDYVDAVDSLCAVSRIHRLFDTDRGNPESLWKKLLAFAHKIAKDMVPGISSRTGALVEVAETANLLEQYSYAATLFEDIHRFIHDRLNSFGEMRIRRERETCLGELMLGLLKTHLWSEAKQLKSDFLAGGAGSNQRKIQDTIALHGIAWLCVCEYDLRGAWSYLHQIKNGAEKSKAARDMAISLAHQGKWRKITEMAFVIERGELKQKYLHKIVRAVAESEKISEHGRKSVYGELLWSCSETFDSALVTLTHLVRCNQKIGLPVAKALEQSFLR